jgi:hypothetical protein
MQLLLWKMTVTHLVKISVVLSATYVSVGCSVHTSLPWDHILRQFNQIYALKLYFSKKYIIIIIIIIIILVISGERLSWQNYGRFGDSRMRSFP